MPRCESWRAAECAVGELVRFGVTLGEQARFEAWALFEVAQRSLGEAVLASVAEASLDRRRGRTGAKCGPLAREAVDFYLRSGEDLDEPLTRSKP
jgi:hypothetical protein